MIRKSGNHFCGKIMLKQLISRASCQRPLA